MNKIELISLINKLTIDKNEFYVLSSGALVLRDLLTNANDLDLKVTNRGLEQLKKQFNLKRKENGWYTVTEDIECVVGNMNYTKVLIWKV